MNVKNNPELVDQLIIYLNHTNKNILYRGEKLESNRKPIGILRGVVFDISLLYVLDGNLDKLRNVKGLGDQTVKRLEAILGSDSIQGALRKMNEGLYHEESSEREVNFSEKALNWDLHNKQGSLYGSGKFRDDDSRPLSLDDYDCM